MDRETTFDRVMEAMRDGHRRRVLSALQVEPPQSAVDVQEIATPPAEFGDGTEPPVNAMLYHAHLPKLEDLGYIRWSREAGTISRGSEWDEIASLVQQLHGHTAELPAELLETVE